MNNALRVAMVESVGGHRGNDSWLFNLCSALQHRDCDVQLFTSDETSYPPSRSLPFDLQLTYKNIYGDDNKIIRGLRYLNGGLQSARIAVEHKTQIAHVHIYHFAYREYLNALFFKNRGMKVVMTVHDVEDFIRYGFKANSKSYLKFEKLASAVIVHSNYAKERLLRYFTSTNPDDIFVTPLPDYDSLYDDPTLTKEKAREKLGLPQNEFIVVFFGQIKKVKGVDVLIKAFSQFNKPDAKLLIAGIPWKVDASNYTDLVEKEDVVDQTILHLRYHPAAMKHVYFRAADVAVLPYREIYSSGVLVNALYYGTPLITSDKPLFKEYLRNGHDCLMFENENAESLANALNEVYTKPYLLEQLKHNARETFAQTFTAEKAAEQTLEVYKRALEKN